MKDIIQYADFDKLDLRIGEVVRSFVPEWSEKLIELTVNFGEELGERTVFAGMKQWYEPGYFENKRFIFIVNLAERKMGDPDNGQGGVSQGMLLAADEGEKPQPIEVCKEVQVGTVIR